MAHSQAKGKDMDHEGLGAPVATRAMSGDYLAFYSSSTMALEPRPSRPSESSQTASSKQFSPQPRPFPY